MEVAFAIFFILLYIGIIVGVCALFVWACGKMAKNKGLPESYKWFGLLGVIGIIVVAVMNPPYPQYPPYNPQYPPQYPQNQYNPYQQNQNQPNTYFGNQPTQYPVQNPNMQQTQVPPMANQAQNPNMASFCPHCGAPVDNYSVTCGMCGKTLR